MTKLFVIGNGFDLYNGLKTRYSDFHSFVSENYSDLENDIENYFSFKVDQCYLWKDFENDLATFNFKNLFDAFNNIDVLSETFRLSDAFGLQDEIIEEVENLTQDIKDAFTSWIKEIDFPNSCNNRTSKIKFNDDCLFINFNYTDTLEIVYQVPKEKILYIHNNANDTFGGLIFGHDKQEEDDPKQEELDENGDSNRTIFTDSEDAARYPFYAFIKHTEDVLEEHDGFFNGLKNIESIIVLGHSLGHVDWPYFQKLSLLFPFAVWKISYYGEDEKKQLKSLAEEMLAGSKLQIEMITIDELEGIE